MPQRINPSRRNGRPARRRQARRPQVALPQTVVVSHIGRRGDGCAPLDGGLVVYIPTTLPGDRVTVRALKPRGDGAAATDFTILARDDADVPPPCPHFARCGGCALQHLTEDAYRVWKQDRAQAVLAALGATADAETVLAPPAVSPLGSRRRATLAACGTRSGAVLGFHRRESHDITSIRVCPVLAPRLAALLAPLGALLSALLAPAQNAAVHLTATDSGADVLIRTDRAPDLAGRERLAAFAAENPVARVSWACNQAESEPVVVVHPPKVTFADVPVTLPAGAFLQATPDGEAAIVAAMLAALPTPGRVIELFAGLGSLSLPLVRAGWRVSAYEGDPAAVAALRRAAEGLAVQAVQRDLFRAPLSGAALRADALVLDPPRAGARDQAAALAAAGPADRPARLVYVSCEPGSFVRDARQLIAGGYRLVRLTPVDQFLYSPHLELVAAFEEGGV